MKKLGFIGVGNMAGAMIGGLIRSGKAAPSDIIGSCTGAVSPFHIPSSFIRLKMPSNNCLQFSIFHS